MQAGGGDSVTASEAPSSDSEASDCEPGPEPDQDAALTEEWARELLEAADEKNAQEVHSSLSSSLTSTKYLLTASISNHYHQLEAISCCFSS